MADCASRIEADLKDMHQRNASFSGPKRIGIAFLANFKPKEHAIYKNIMRRIGPQVGEPFGDERPKFYLPKSGHSYA